MDFVDLKNYVRTIVIDLTDELGESATITLREPDSFQYLDLQKASKESEESAFKWAADNLSSLIVSHTFTGVNDVKELATELTKRLDVLLKIVVGIGDFRAESNQKQKKPRK